ncbi:hypothetical protein [Lactobacillus johnsonii]|uniref:Uncharacterized protein n=1 Tax=Lactobacillus johnsonii TaxID=33959 RepID=A0A9X4XAN0_LACJH|nr:hypothetical protein [Lactobacillus johnsonii]MTE03643.1 hypothetical protein [Lactobacillus johnsonii]
MYKETSLYELLRLKIMQKETIATKEWATLSWQIFRFEIAKNTDAYIEIGYNRYYWELVIKLADLQDSLIDKIVQLPELSEKLGLTFIVAHEIVDPDYFPNENPKNLELRFQKKDEQGTIKADELIKKYFLQKNSDMIAIFDLPIRIRKNSKDNDVYDLVNEMKRAFGLNRETPIKRIGELNKDR